VEDEAPGGEEPTGPPPEIGREDLMMLLYSVPERVADVITGLHPGQLRYRHGPAFPTAGEVAAHVAAAGLQLDHFITSVSLETSAPPALATMLEAPTPAEPPSLPEAVADWQRVRRRGVDLLRGLAGDRWERSFDDPLRGEVTVEEALRLVLRHELGHVAQLRNLTSLVPETAAAEPAGGAAHA
jgi:uncharacterized damage-inducible protein DinB